MPESIEGPGAKTDKETGRPVMRTGSSGLVRFRFLYGVELIEEGSRIMIREGKTQACGVITKIYSMNTPSEEIESL